MAWYIDSVRLFVQEEQQDDKQIIARLNPVNDGTTLQVFGYDDPIIKISAYIVGTGDATLVRNMAKDGVQHNLSYPEAFVIDLIYVNSVSTKRTKSVAQTLRSDLDCTAPVYIVDLELYE